MSGGAGSGLPPATKRSRSGLPAMRKAPKGGDAEDEAAAAAMAAKKRQKARSAPPGGILCRWCFEDSDAVEFPLNDGAPYGKACNLCRKKITANFPRHQTYESVEKHAEENDKFRLEVEEVCQRPAKGRAKSKDQVVSRHPHVLGRRQGLGFRTCFYSTKKQARPPPYRCQPVMRMSGRPGGTSKQGLNAKRGR